MILHVTAFSRVCIGMYPTLGSLTSRSSVDDNLTVIMGHETASTHSPVLLKETHTDRVDLGFYLLWV